LTLSSVHVAHGTTGRDTVDTATDAHATFGGRDTVTILPGAAAVSDVVTLAAPSLADLAVSMYVISAPAGVTGHPGSRTTSYLLQGNRADARTLSGASKTEHWYLLSRIDVLAPPSAAAVVILGNSIADGRGSGTDKNDRWPDNLARRLRAGAATREISVLNAGIGGNAVLTGGLGPTALQRLDRDVLDQPGVRWLIVSEGVNDLGTSRPGLADSVATKLIGAYREIVTRARARHLRVYGATILPFGASFYSTPDREAARQRINAWIRARGNFDGVIDFDAAMRDPAEPTRLRSDADGGDHLHPNENGYRIMAEAIELSRFAEQ
jgi:lysophospholipase L1-like esterase